MATKHINLLAPHLRRATHRFSLKMMLYALGTIGAVMVGVGNLQKIEVGRLKSASGTLDADVKRLEESIKSLTEAAAKRKPNPDLEREAAQLEERLQLQRRIVSALETGGLGDTRGFGDYLAALARTRNEGVWLTQFGVNAVESLVFLRGRALTPDAVPAYIKRLNAEPIFRGRAFNDVLLKEVSEAGRGAAAAPGGGASAANRSVVEFTLGVPVGAGGGR